MFSLKVENAKGAILELTNDETNFQVTNVEGLNPPNAPINTSDFANGDGSAFNSSKIRILFTGEMKPFIIKHYENEDVIQLVLPVRTF